MAANPNGCTTGTLQLSIDGLSYSTQEAISDLGDGNNIITITQPTIDPVKYKSFRFIFSDFDNSTNFQINSIFAYIPDNLDSYSFPSSMYIFRKRH